MRLFLMLSSPTDAWWSYMIVKLSPIYMLASRTYSFKLGLPSPSRRSPTKYKFTTHEGHDRKHVWCCPGRLHICRIVRPLSFCCIIIAFMLTHHGSLYGITCVQTCIYNLVFSKDSRMMKSMVNTIALSTVSLWLNIFTLFSGQFVMVGGGRVM